MRKHGTRHIILKGFPACSGYCQGSRDLSRLRLSVRIQTDSTCALTLHLG